MTDRRVLVRTDATPQAGTGHLMRCLALAVAYRQSGGEARFALAHDPGALQSRLRDLRFEAERLAVVPGSPADADATVRAARSFGAAWVVLDGYQFDAAYQRRIQSAGLRLLYIDDFAHLDAYPADLVLNHGVAASQGAYARRGAWTELLLGPRYALLRPEFAAVRDRPRTARPEGRRVLLTLGGADAPNATQRILEALGGVAGRLEIDAVVGPQNPHEASLRAAVRESRHVVRLLVAPEDLSELMERADVAIAAGGGTASELCAAGVPMLLLVLAENQRPVVTGLARAGAAIDLGWHADLDPKTAARSIEGLLADPARREAMSRAGRALVDGRGAGRVAGAIDRASLHLRPAEAEDARLLWEWANEADTRRQSFSEEPIPWESHVAWFEGKRRDPRVRLYVALGVDGRPVGQFRADRENGTATVSVSVDAARRGEGFGAALIRAGSRRALDDLPVKQLEAFVKPENEASLRAFMRAGYSAPTPTRVKGRDAVRLVLQRPASP